MKTIIILAGILLIAGGCYFVYDGYQLRQTAGAQIEKEVSSVVKALSDSKVKVKTSVNAESALTMIGGGVGVIGGILILAGGLRRKK